MTEGRVGEFIINDIFNKDKPLDSYIYSFCDIPGTGEEPEI